MPDVYSFALRARGKLAQEASRKDPNLRTLLGHAQLLDRLCFELSTTESTWIESDAQDEVTGDSEEDRSNPQDSDDSDSDSDSDLDWGSDSDSDSENDSDTDSDEEWFSYTYGADVENTARDWAQAVEGKSTTPLADLTGGPLEVTCCVQEVWDAIET